MTIVQTTTPSCPLLAVMSPLQRERRVGWELKDGDEWKVKQVSTIVGLGHQSQTFWGLIGRTDDNKAVQMYSFRWLWPPKSNFLETYWANWWQQLSTIISLEPAVATKCFLPGLLDEWARTDENKWRPSDTRHSKWPFTPHGGKMKQRKELVFFCFQHLSLRVAGPPP